MRSFAGLYFVVRLMIFVSNLIAGVLLISQDDPFLVGNIIFTITTLRLLVALCRPYKEVYMNVMYWTHCF